MVSSIIIKKRGGLPKKQHFKKKLKKTTSAMYQQQTKARFRAEMKGFPVPWALLRTLRRLPMLLGTGIDNGRIPNGLSFM
jgi:hypothetical protein